MKIGKIVLKKKHRPLLFLLLLVLVLTAAALYTLVYKNSQEKEEVVYKEETVKRGDVVQGVMESGSISMEENQISFDVDLSTDDEEEDTDTEEDSEEEEDEEINYLEIEKVYVVTGQRIKTGDPLFAITEKSRSAVERKLSSALTEKEVALADAKAEYNSQVLEAKGTYDSSKLLAEKASVQLAATDTQLTEEINGLSSQVAVLELEINQCLEKLTDEDFLESCEEARLAFLKAEEKFQETDAHATTAYTANYQEYESAKTQYESLLSQKEGWEETIAKNQETIHENNQTILEKQSILEAKTQEAQSTKDLNTAAGELAGAVYDYTKESLQSTVDSAQADVDEARENLDALQAFVGEDGIVYADQDGMVTAVSYEEGDELTQTGTMLTYVQEDSYTVSVDVSEEDIAGISIGDTVRIVFDAYGEEEYTGLVNSVTTTKTSDYAKTVSYPVEIKIQGDTQKLFGGMTAEITFVSQEVQDVLYVSRKAIVEKDGKTYVYTGDENQKQLVEVETGFENSTMVEIKSGLSEGDIIYIQAAA